MKKFNLNNYMLVQITSVGWQHLSNTLESDYIKYCILAHKQMIFNSDTDRMEEWYKLQAHYVMNLFGQNLEGIKSNVLIHDRHNVID